MTRRSRFGCQTCKIRRVKCDETQPSCRRCTETGRKCEGPPKNKAIFLAPTTFQQQHWLLTRTEHKHVRHLSPVAQIATHSVPAGGERAFTFFLESASPALQGELDHAFWGNSVLQMCHGNSVLQNAILALSTLSETPLERPLQWPTSVAVNFPQSVHQQAFRWYSKSLRGLPAVLDQVDDHDTLSMALTSCIIVACIEIQQLNVVNSMMLMRCGYNLLAQKGAVSLGPQSTLIKDVILPIFIQQTIILSLHGYSLPDGWLPSCYTGSQEKSTPIGSLKDARTQLHLIMLDQMLAYEHLQTTCGRVTKSSAQELQQQSLDKLGDWRRRLDQLVATLVASESSHIRAISLLLAHHSVATIWSYAYTDASEMVYDNHLPYFVAILDHIETYLFSLATTSTVMRCTYSFETRIIPSLYYVGWRCRDPQIRRRALQLMKRAPVQENLFHRDVQIWALRRIIQLEEGLQLRNADMAEVETVKGSTPSEARRLKHVVVRWSMRDGASVPQLVYSQWPLREDEDGELRSVQSDIKISADIGTKHWSKT